MDMKRYVILIEELNDKPGIYYVGRDGNGKNDIKEEWPNAKWFEIEDYPDKDMVADFIVQIIGSELENANWHRVNGIQDEIYSNLVKAGVDKMIAAKSLFDAFDGYI